MVAMCKVLTREVLEQRESTAADCGNLVVAVDRAKRRFDKAVVNHHPFDWF